MGSTCGIVENMSLMAMVNNVPLRRAFLGNTVVLGGYLRKVPQDSYLERTFIEVTLEYVWEEASKACLWRVKRM